MMGGCSPGSPETETVNGTVYRKGISCRDQVGPAISYNSGTMLSGAADLYRATGDDQYLTDGRRLADASFTYFAKTRTNLIRYYTYDISGFNDWFNGVLMRGYVALFPAYAMWQITLIVSRKISTMGMRTSFTTGSFHKLVGRLELRQ